MASKIPVLLAFMGLAAAALAEPLPTGTLERRCWLSHTQQRTAVEEQALHAVDE